jgi:uncharacterized protein (TIGR02246 family)
MRRGILLGMALGLLALGPARAQDKDPTKKEDPAHQELRNLRTQLVTACNKGDIDGVLPLLDKDVVVTWLNGEVSRGPQQVREYVERMIKGPNKIVERFETNPEAAELTHLYGDTGVAYGTSKDHFVLTDGKDFVVPTKWSATLVKKDGKWVIANFHSSTSMFDNPVLDIAIRKTATWVGIGAGAGGLLVGFLLALLLRRRPAAV